jgi:uncharacterized lipoprotein YmbA
VKQEERCSFLKKRTKKLLSLCARCRRVAPQQSKVFCFFFSKKKSLSSFALMAVLSACSSPDPTFYTLQPIPGVAIAGGPATVEIRRPGLAGYLDRSDIVLKSAAYELSMNSQHRWGEPLGDMIGRVLTQDLSQRLPGTDTFAQTGAITADPQLRVEVDILNFDTDASGNVVLNAGVAIERGLSHAPLAAHHVALTAQPAGPGAAELAATMSTLLGELADRIATDIRALPPAPT